MIEVLNMDTLEGLFELQDAGYNPVLHNMCNDRVRGGFHHLVGAQEEDLIRRGNYLEFLNKEKYPIPIDGVIYSSGVTFTKTRTGEKYTSPRNANIIACAAVRNQEMGIRLNEFDEKVMRYKIELIFETARINKHDAIVLSAFGCGGFRCPPEHVSILFKEAIDRGWKNEFKRIRFCIFDENYPNSNFSIFKKCFEY